MIQVPASSPPVRLPAFGEVYKVAGHIQNPRDKKPNRRALVVWVPGDVDDRIRLVTRTTDTNRKGVRSSKDSTMGFDCDGVWGHYRSVDARLWVPPDVVYLGILDPDIVHQICCFYQIIRSGS